MAPVLTQKGQIITTTLAAVTLGMAAVLVVTRQTIKAAAVLAVTDIEAATDTKQVSPTTQMMVLGLAAAATTHRPMELALAAVQG